MQRILGFLYFSYRGQYRGQFKIKIPEIDWLNFIKTPFFFLTYSMEFSTFKHSYELGVVDIYIKHVKRLRQDIKLSYFERKSRIQSLKYAVEAVLISQGLNSKKVIEDRYSVMVLPENNPDSFDCWLALYLSVLPSYTIELVLEYYFKRLYYSKIFINRLEFFVISIIEADPHLFNHDLLERISNWILNKREMNIARIEDFKPKHSTSNESKIEKPKKDQNTNKGIHMGEVRQAQLYDVLVKYIDVEKHGELLKKALQGKYIHEKIELSLKKISFAFTIYSLKRHDVIYDEVNENIYNWINQSFSFFNKSTNKRTSISISLLKKVFSGKETPKDNAILDIRKLLKSPPVSI